MIYSETGIYAGWPANHGLWQWDNEILVGFIAGKYLESDLCVHRVEGKLDFLQARSMDYGQTWNIEKTMIQEIFLEYNCIPFKGKFKDTIFRVRGNYDHGGDILSPSAGFYSSEDRGNNWTGPHLFEGLDFNSGAENSSRTCVLNDKFYLTRKKEMIWASDEVMVIEYIDKFKEVDSLKRDYRTVMPSVVECEMGLFMAVRIKNHPEIRDGIEIFKKSSNSWVSIKIFDTGNNNGNPPNLSYKDGKLYCFYGNRRNKQIVSQSTEDLLNWENKILAEAITDDFGYCQSFKTKEGIGIIYYEDNGIDRSEIKMVEACL